jgi:hypothetical protein
VNATIKSLVLNSFILDNLFHGKTVSQTLENVLHFSHSDLRGRLCLNFLCADVLAVVSTVDPDFANGRIGNCARLEK